MQKEIAAKEIHRFPDKRAGIMSSGNQAITVLEHEGEKDGHEADTRTSFQDLSGRRRANAARLLQRRLKALSIFTTFTL